MLRDPAGEREKVGRDGKGGKGVDYRKKIPRKHTKREDLEGVGGAVDPRSQEMAELRRVLAFKKEENDTKGNSRAFGCGGGVFSFTRQSEGNFLG